MAPVSTSVASRSLLFPVFPLPGTSRSPFLLLPGPSRPSASDIHLLFYHVSLSFTGPSLPGSKHSASTLYFIHFQVSLFLLSLYFHVFQDPLLLRCPSPLLPDLSVSSSLGFQLHFPPESPRFRRSSKDRSAVIRSDCMGPPSPASRPNVPRMLNPWTTAS